MSNQQPNQPPSSSSQQSFPSLGVKLVHLRRFVENCGGRQELQGLTTTDVRDNFIIPMTLVENNSYCEMLQSTSPEEVGEANVFVSHAWKYTFLEVVDLLENYFEKNKEKKIISTKKAKAMTKKKTKTKKR